ncbi:pyrroline-5-carboxylate reductase dimerization domain-containing protein, partial [Campylobacter coli]
LNLTRSLFKSAAALLENEHPAIIKENICSPAGVTIKGIKVLEVRNLAQNYDERLFNYLLEESKYKEEFKNRFFIFNKKVLIFK